MIEVCEHCGKEFDEESLDSCILDGSELPFCSEECWEQYMKNHGAWDE